jgi:hypothetical protein
MLFRKAADPPVTGRWEAHVTPKLIEATSSEGAERAPPVSGVIRNMASPRRLHPFCGGGWTDGAT